MARSVPFRNVCIVGNIASGKSALTGLLAEEISNSVAIPESFEQNAFLELNFQDPPRWAFTNAVRYFYDYVRVFQTVTAAKNYRHHFIDAGAPTNRQVYGRHMLEQGFVTRAEYDFYETLCDVIARAFDYPPPDAYIFIACAPELCSARMRERMKEREWAYQRPISLKYIAGLNKYFENFQALLRAQGAPVLQINSATTNFLTPAGRRETVQRVRAFIESPDGFAD